MKKRQKPKVILVTGACGQIGTELVRALRAQGEGLVIASDLKPREFMAADEFYRPLNVMDARELERVVTCFGVTEIYHLAAILSASGENDPLQSWELNTKSLLNVLETARKYKLDKVFWPSSIAIFGPDSMPAVCFQNAKPDPLTVYGISKVSGEYWCRYYKRQYGLDIRSLRYPGLISHSAPPGGGTTDYAVELFHEALLKNTYTCFLKENTCLPMLYMPDAIRGTLQLMAAPKGNLLVETSYNMTGMSFTPGELVSAIQKHIPALVVRYEPDSRQYIAENWPMSINDSRAQQEWGWQPLYDLAAMVSDMLLNLKKERTVYA